MRLDAMSSAAELFCVRLGEEDFLAAGKPAKTELEPLHDFAFATVRQDDSDGLRHPGQLKKQTHRAM